MRGIARKGADLGLRLWPFAKLLADELQVIVVKALFIFAITMLPFSLDNVAGIAARVLTVILFVFVFVNNKTFADLRSRF